jgi:hypothetical protein
MNNFKGRDPIEESAKLTQPTPSDQTSTALVPVSALHEQSLKKDYRRPKLESLGTVRTATAAS